MPQHTHAEGTGGIRRGPRLADNFTVLSNAVINDQRLSFRARAVLIWLLSKPADWSVRSDAIAAQSPTEGREAVRTAMRELARFGYLVREKIQDERGRWSTIQTVYEQPASGEQPPPDPKPGKSDSGAADAGEPGALTKDRSPRTKTNNDRAARARRSRTDVGASVSSSGRPDRREPADVPGRYTDLGAACLAAGLTATFEFVKPHQQREILALIDAHGISALVDRAKAVHRDADPTLFAQGWIRAWNAIPRRLSGPASRPRCGECEGSGFVLNDDDLAARCACRTAVAA